ncbi:MAG: SLC13 family permease [Candidatus Cloacimonadaceae bacterium]
MFETIFVLLIFGLTYLCFITEWVNKMTAVLLGGFLIIISQIMTQEKAFSYIDWNVIFLLIGMMIIMGVFKETGIFQYIAVKTAKLAHGNPVLILLLMFAVTAAISAFLDNVTTVIIIIPVNLLIASELGISPVPFIVTEVIASNIGGTATLIGDPPNIMIGSANHLTFMDFIKHLAPIILLITLVGIVLFYFLFRKRLQVSNERRAKIMEFSDKNLITNKRLLIRAIIVMSLLMVGFVFQETLHLSSATIAMTAALILLIISDRKEVEQIVVHSIDWVSILFFVGLFMLVGGLNEAGILGKVAPVFVKLTKGDFKLATLSMVWLAGILSSVVGSVPLVATLIPLLKNITSAFPTPSFQPMWWALSLGSCLGGNGTMIGAAANIVAVGIAKKNGFRITFWQFMKYSGIITFVSLLLSTVYLYLRYF